MYISITEHIAINRESHSIRIDDNTIHLTKLEFALLDYLASNANRVCSREEIIDHIWGKQFCYDTGTIDVHLNAIRRKLSFTRNKPIETIRGVGFIFRIEKVLNHYTIDLQSFISDWLYSHEMEIRSKGLLPSMQLTPFVNNITIAPEALKTMLDAILQALLPTAQPGVLKVQSKLTINYFILALDINGTSNELRIPCLE